MRHIGLFEGIGWFSLAADWIGWETIAWCEWNPFGQKVLKYHFPKATGHGDITKTDFTIYRGQCDILTGGFPCQPYSHAGKRLGKEDDRHLWPEMLRAIREISPRWVVGENVSGLLSWNGGLVFNEVQADLEAAGYEVLPFLLPACAVNAPHRRDRIWFIAFKNTGGDGCRNGEYDKQGGIWDIRQSCTGSQKRDIITEIESNATAYSRLQRQAERQQQPMGVEQLRKEQSTTNPTSDRRERNGQGIEIEEGLQQEPKSNRELERGFEGLCGTGDVANSAGEQSEWVQPKQREFSEQEQRQFGRNGCGLGRSGISSDTRLQRQAFSKQQATRIEQCSRWECFPTQPPVCSRNDGLPAELVGITVPKHRNESIKAYGNAIVPQVALQIFKAIEQMENTFQPTQ